MAKENWKNVLGFEGHYQASDLGQIKSLDVQYETGNRFNNSKTMVTRKGKILKQVDMGLGYLQVCLSKDKKGHSLYVHLLVWEAFNGPIPKGMQINHINEDKSDNRLENLELVTPKENCNYGTRNIRVLETKANRSYNKKGAAPRRVLMSSLDDIPEKDFASIQNAMSFLGKKGSSSNISNVCSGKKYHNTAYGHKWSYI